MGTMVAFYSHGFGTDFSLLKLIAEHKKAHFLGSAAAAACMVGLALSKGRASGSYGQAQEALSRVWRVT